MLKIDWRYLHHSIDLDPMNSGIVLMAWQAQSKQMDSFLILSRYVAQQCSKPVSLLGDQKGLRMIKVGGLHHSWLSLEKGHCIKHNLLFYFQLSSWSDQMEKFFRLALSGFSEEPEQPPPRTSRFFSSNRELFFIFFEGGRVHPKQSGSGASWHTIPLSPITGSTFDHNHYFH